MVEAANKGARPASGKGLEGIVASTTSLSSIDGNAGRLHYRGYAIEDLAEQTSFEEIIALLWDGELPTRAQLDALQAELAAQRALPERSLRLLRDLSPRAVPIAALRTIVSALEAEDESPTAHDLPALRAKAVALAARMPTIVAAQARLRQGREPVAPDPDLDHAANFLWMLTGERPSAARAAAMDNYLVLLAEHSLNASTFTARIVTSTGADIYGVITAALAALQGDAHGGANQRAMEMFREIGSADRVEDFVTGALATKRRLMGIGHRVYRVLDPRAPIMERDVDALIAAGGAPEMAEVARALEALTARHPYYVERKLSPNVDFFSAPLLDLIGLPADLFPSAFGCARIAGWVGHLLEQFADNRLIRPLAEYTGPPPRPFVPLAERG